jgi:hypothetical protein
MTKYVGGKPKPSTVKVPAKRPAPQPVQPAAPPKRPTGPNPSPVQPKAPPKRPTGPNPSGK